MRKKKDITELPIYNGARPLANSFVFTNEMEIGYRNSKTGEEWQIRNYADGKKERCRLRVETGTLERMFNPNANP